MAFQKGQSGNPHGKPKGTRHRVTVAAETLLEGEAEAITRKAIELAKQGDGPALRLCMDRIGAKGSTCEVQAAAPRKGWGRGRRERCPGRRRRKRRPHTFRSGR